MTNRYAIGAPGPACDWYQPFTQEQANHPEPVWERLRREMPVSYSSAAEAWIVSRHADCAAVLGDPEHFSNSAASRVLAHRPADVQAILDEVPDPLEMDIIAADPPRHARLRRTLQSAFTPRRVAQLEPSTRQIADGLIDEFIDDGTCNIYERFAFRLPLLVICELLALPRELAPRLNQLATSSIAVRFGHFTDHAEHLAAARGRVDLYRFGEALIQERRQNPGDDMVSELVAAGDSADEPLTEPELVHQVISLVSAGHETSANWITMALYHLLADPGLWRRLGDSPAVIERTIEETLRFSGPINAVWRIATSDIAVGGTTIPAGARVGVMIGSANHDEAVFECPLALDPDRAKPERHLTFGRGIHFCVGAGLARQEGRVALEQLRSRIPSLRLSDPGPLEFHPNAVLRVPVGFEVAWDTPRARPLKGNADGS